MQRVRHAGRRECALDRRICASVGNFAAVVEIRVRAEAGQLGARLPLIGSGSMEQGVSDMKADALRTAATWLAAMFVGTLFVAASTSFAGLA
jgi:hypothetical protein